MVQPMDMDEENVAMKQESTGSNGISDAPKEEATVSISTDKVTRLQDSIDRMALTMFNALRLLPVSTEQDNETEREEKMKSIKELAGDVVQIAKETDELIDELPGLDKTESEQLGEMQRLQLQSDEEAQTLRQVAEEAERWMERARESLRVISETRLKRS